MPPLRCPLPRFCLLQEVKGLEAQIASSGLTVEVDAPKSQDLSKIMADIRAQYEELAQKNREELDKYWSQQVCKRKGWLPGCEGEAAKEGRS